MNQKLPLGMETKIGQECDRLSLEIAEKRKGAGQLLGEALIDGTKKACELTTRESK